jgi:hypothetical protein
VTVVVNGLPVTPTRRALIKAVTEPGRIYYEPDAKAAYDRASGRKVTAVLRELLRAEWIRAARADERRRGESKHLIYYRPTDVFGRAALNGEAR